ncbi:MAG TPA: TonB-dependent receptor, partial [Longimicrobiales bacterium]|nr:TonB-dependent receptor [Longimicrobiales bacterium]
RVTLGGDLTRTRAWVFFPKNDLNWYSSPRTNSGTIDEARYHADRWTADYLGNYAVDMSPTLRADLSAGFQTLITRTDRVDASGVGLVANAARSVGAASERTGTQSVGQNISNGVLGQVQLSHRDRLYVQLAGRLDRNSAFGAESKYFFSPRVGASYVLSDESFWQNSGLGSAVNTFRLRAAYGTTGRSPTTGALATYDPDVYVLPASAAIQPGVTPQNPGNSALKPERGTELEAGFEAGLLNDRLSLEVTYFNKKTNDAILERPIAPSLGFDDDPFVNIGEIVNRGLEISATARILTLPQLGWETNLTFNTLHNEVTDLGDVDPFGTQYRTREGAPVGSFHTYVVRSVDVANNVAIVSNDLEFVGNVLPGWEGTFGSTVNFLGNFTAYAQLDFRGDVYRYEGSAQFRDRQFRNSANWVFRNDTTFMSAEERLRRFGPFKKENGETITFGNVGGAYIEDASFLRLREVSLSYRIPESFAARFMRARDASISVAGRNLAVWTGYSGLDPETIYASNTEFFTVPADRRFLLRVSASY